MPAMIEQPGGPAVSLFRIVSEGTFWISASTLIVKVVSLAAVFIILKRLGVAEYGTLELVLSVTSLMSIFLLPGLDMLVVADMGSEKGRGEYSKARNILSAYLVLQLILSILAWALVFFGASYFARFYGVPAHYIQLIAFTFLLAPFRSAYGILFRVNLRFFLLSLLTFLEECAKLTILASLFFFTDFRIAGVLMAIVGAQFAALLMLTPQFLSGWFGLVGGANTLVKLVWWELLLGHGKWSVLSTYVGNLGKAVRLWIIQRTLGAEAVGVYAVALGLIGHTIALAPLYSVVTPILPQFVHDQERFTKLLNKAMKYQFIAYLGVGLVAVVAFPPVVQWLFPDYSAAMPLFQIMLIGLIPVAFISVFTPAFFALKLQKSLFVSMIFKTVVSILLTYGLAVFFGIWGLAYEYTLTSLIYGFERMRSLRRHVPDIRINPHHIATFDEDDRLLLRRAFSFVGRITPDFIRR